jgi:hypothetical protein
MTCPTLPIPVLILAAAVAGWGEGNPSELAPPFAVTAGGTPIDASRNGEGCLLYDNDYPWLADFDGDGKLDLLVGHHSYEAEVGKSSGRLRIYPNVGERGRPLFGKVSWFDDQNPTGRIPGG